MGNKVDRAADNKSVGAPIARRQRKAQEPEEERKKPHRGNKRLDLDEEQTSATHLNIDCETTHNKQTTTTLDALISAHASSRRRNSSRLDRRRNALQERSIVVSAAAQCDSGELIVRRRRRR